MRAASEQSRERSPRSIAGLRASALAETLVLLAIALLIDGFLFNGDRFGAVSPHPFWIVVLLIAAQYGTSEALVAAVLCSAGLLVDNLPEQAFNEDLYAWLLRISYNPVLWCIAAVTLGEIRAGHRRKAEALQRELDEAQEQARAFADAYERQSRIKTTLEVLVAGQQRTVRTMRAAACAIERQSTIEVLTGIPVLVRSVIGPEKFSFYLLNGSVLELAAKKGWTSEDDFRRVFTAASPLFAAVVAERQLLTASDPAHELILAEEGLLAGPLFSEETGEVFGMLKIEALPFQEFTPGTFQNFQIVCDWIGTAFAKAQRFEQLRDTHKPPSLLEIR
ncbi:MAG TPA: GAF domain-containing protein [Acetobacteraceae bacterium]